MSQMVRSFGMMVGLVVIGLSTGCMTSPGNGEYIGKKNLSIALADLLRIPEKQYPFGPRRMLGVAVFRNDPFQYYTDLFQRGQLVFVESNGRLSLRHAGRSHQFCGGRTGSDQRPR